MDGTNGMDGDKENDFQSNTEDYRMKQRISRIITASIISISLLAVIFIAIYIYTLSELAKTLEPGKKENQATVLTIKHPNLNETLLMRKYYWKENQEWHRKLIISPNNCYNDSLSQEYSYVFSDSNYPKCYVFSDSSIILFVKDSFTTPKYFISKIKIEQKLENTFRDSETNTIKYQIIYSL